MARELREQDKDINSGMYHLSSMTGSLRYMAPEVGMGQPYNETCDIFSFTIVLWEMLSLQRAYASTGAASMTQDNFMKMVFDDMKRPPIRFSWSKTLRELLRNGWAHSPHDRPSASKVHTVLRRQLVNMRHGDDSGLEFTARRSTFLADEGIRHAGNQRSRSIPRRSSTVRDSF